MIPAGTILIAGGVIGLATAVRSSRPFHFREIGRTISVLMIVVVLNAMLVLLRDDSISGATEDAALTTFPTLVLLLAMMLLRASSRQDEALRTTGGLYDTMLEHADDAVLSLDVGFRVLHANPAAQKLIGEELQNVTGARLESVLVAVGAKQLHFVRDWREGLRTGQAQFAPETLVTNCSGAQRWLAVSLVPVLDADRIHGVLLFIRDISYLQEFERERADLEAREKMLVLLTHELRTPLSIIRGYADLLQRSRKKNLLPDLKHLDGISVQTARMSEFVNRIMQARRDEALESHKQPVELLEFIRGIVEHFAVGASEHRVSMLSCVEPVYVDADPEMLEHSLNNLLGNAAKYTQPDTIIRVDVRRLGDNVRVAVHDEGEGIPAAELERLFDCFYRGSNSGRANGLGLGLHFVRQVIEDHGGSIWVESEPGKGTIFYFTLPVLHLSTVPQPGAHSLTAQTKGV